MCHPPRVDVRIGYLPTRLDGSAAAWRKAVQLAEAAGIDHVAVGDHVSFHDGSGADGLTAAAVVFGVAERLHVNTAVYLLPLRHPVTVARQVADLAALGPGRFTLGVGIGGEDPHEVEVCGVDPRTRGRRMDEAITIVRELLAGETVDHAGEHFQLEGACILPVPTSPVPIVVGGRSDAAISRAGRLGDGWIGVWVSARRFAEVVLQVAAVAEQEGRGVDRWRHALNVWCGVGRDTADARRYVAPAMEDFYKLPYERFERWSPAGTAEELAAFLIPYIEAGCSTFNLIINGEDVDAEMAAVAEIRARMLDVIG